MRRLVLRLLLTLSLALLALPAAARDVFVNNVTGDDHLDGSAPLRGDGSTGPMKTIGRALAIAEKSSRIVLAKTDQPYRETLSLSARNRRGVLVLFFFAIRQRRRSRVIPGVR